MTEGCYRPPAGRNMQPIVKVSLVLVNVVWIVFFSTSDPFLVFVQKRRCSSSSEKDMLLGEFCIQTPFNLDWTPARTQTNTSTALCAKKNEASNSMTKRLTSAAPKMKLNVNTQAKPKINMNPPVQQDANAKPKTPPNSPSVALTCCFMFSTRMLAKKIIRSYFVTSPHCQKTAVWFVTTAGSHICVNPKLMWVQKIMEDLDKETH